jgi:hypothetical protein
MRAIPTLAENQARIAFKAATIRMLRRLGGFNHNSIPEVGQVWIHRSPHPKENGLVRIAMWNKGNAILVVERLSDGKEMGVHVLDLFPKPGELYFTPNPGIKQDFEAGGLSGTVQWAGDDAISKALKQLRNNPLPIQVGPEPSFEAIGQGVVRWCRQAPRHRRVTLEAQGDMVLAVVESFPSRVHANVVFIHADTVENVLAKLDRSLAKAADNPESRVADPLEFP